MTDLTIPLTEQEKKDWICDHYNGSWELWIDPAALFDRIAELEADEAKLREALAKAAPIVRAFHTTSKQVPTPKVLMDQIEAALLAINHHSRCE